MRQLVRWGAAWSFLVSLALGPERAWGAEADADILRQLRQLQQQNEALQQQMRKQQELIDELSGKISRIEIDDGREAETRNAKSEVRKESPPLAERSGFSLGKVHLSGEGAVGFFHSQPRGQFPNAEFRVDEAKLFIESPIWKEVYFFSEINAFTREEGVLSVGEVYLDAENVSRLWNQDRQVSLRIGRFDVPFGEEYLTRDAIDNPLISHSIMDLWGVDEGVEFYGAFNKLQYVLAVQNGNHDTLRDFNSDKSVALRIGVDPAPWLHLSVSAMRTGDLGATSDWVSELWLGPGLIYSLGSAQTTEFHANLLEGDVHVKLPRTTLKGSGGVLQYGDNDPLAKNRRDVYYYYLEAVQNIHKGFYAAARWSQVFAPKGFPIAGIGDGPTYGWGPNITRDLWLLSLGLGYRWSNQLVVKGEYSFEHGREIEGARRNHEDLLALTAAFAF